MAVPYLPIGISAAVLGAMLLWGRDSSAATNGGMLPGPGPGPAPGPRPVQFPANAALALVSIPTGEGSMNIRPTPSPGGQPRGSVPNGETVAVLTGEIPEEGLGAGAPNRWRRILTRTGVTGYVRFVGPQGESNFRPTGTVPWPGAGEMREIALVTAGVPASVGQYPYPYAAYAAGYPYPAGYPGAYPGLGWAAWGSGFSPRVDIIGQGRARARCGPRGCALWAYTPGWSAIGYLAPGSLVEVLEGITPSEPGNWTRVRGPSARGGTIEGWTRRENLTPAAAAVREPFVATPDLRGQVFAPFARRTMRDDPNLSMLGLR